MNYFQHTIQNLGDKRIGGNVVWFPCENETNNPGTTTCQSLVIRVRQGSGPFKVQQHENPGFTTADPVTIVDMTKPLTPELRTAAEGFLVTSRKAGIVRIFYGYGGIEPYLEKVLWPKTEFLLTHGQQD